MKNVSASSKLSIETSTEGIKPMKIKKKKQVDYRKVSVLVALRNLLLNSGASLGISFFWSEFAFRNLVLSVDTFREEIKPVGSSEFEFEDVLKSFFDGK